MRKRTKERRRIPKRFFLVPFSVLFCLILSVPAFLPFPQRIPTEGDSYRCEWEDGSVSEENFAALYSDFVGTDGEFIYIERGGVHGKCELCAKELYRTLKRGNFGELNALRLSGAESRLDRAALFRTGPHPRWFADEYYEWTGASLKRTRVRECESLVCLSGKIASPLKATRAEAVDLRAEAEMTADAFLGTNVGSVTAEPPYGTEHGLVYLDTVSGRRLIAAIPNVAEAEVKSDYCDEGALLAAEGLCRLKLPFLGSGADVNSSYYRGELAHLFSLNGEYRVPESLKSVRVTGGAVISYAFYACPLIEEVDLCGVNPADISPTAFLNLSSLRILHVPKRDVLLPAGTFSSSTAACGCTVYERI